MYDGCRPAADPRSNGSPLVPSLPRSFSLLAFLPMLHHVCARALWHAEKDTDRLEAFYDRRQAMANVSFLHSEVTRCTGRKDDSLACAFGLRDCTGHLEKPTSLMRITVYDANEK